MLAPLSRSGSGFGAILLARVQRDFVWLRHAVALAAAVDIQRGDAVIALRVLALTRYGALGASSRMRFLQYLPTLATQGVQVKVQALFDDPALAARYRLGRYGLGMVLRCFARRLAALRARQQFDVLWIEKEALPWCPLWLETTLLRGVPYILDYDDAVFHNYDLHRLRWVRRLYGRRLDGLMRSASLVVCGNEYLAARARAAGAPWVELLPTVIDLDRYPTPAIKPARLADQPPRIVWIGSPSTLGYLQVLKEPLQALATRLPFVLRVIGGDFSLPGVQVECVPWAEDTEVAAIAACDVGVMPLIDSPWERGKCGYKLIQYMACGLPVVASPVGVNSSIVQNGVNGFLAEGAQEWLDALERMLTQADLRVRLGAAGRQQVEKEYCLQVTGPRLADWLRSAARED